MIQSRSAKQATSYFNQELRKSDYYTDDQELEGKFFGKIARRLGVQGIVDRKVFHRLARNIHPITGKKLTIRQKANRTVGYDLTFLCPKSVSVIHGLSKDDHILKAFQDSVRETMRDIERDSKARVRKKGKNEERRTGKLIWAEFVHQTARPVKGYVPDPHLHAHCFTFNVTWDREEKQYKACQFRDINRDMPYYQARYHKRFADRLIKLGYQIKLTEKAFEIENVPEEVLGLFSKRTGEVEDFANKHGIRDAKALGKLAARTRSKKQKGLTLGQLKRSWREQIKTLEKASDGKDDKAIRFDKDTVTESIDAKASVDYALQERFERVSVVQDRRLLETAYRRSLGLQGSTVKTIDRIFKSDKRIIHVKDGSRDLCTTKDVLKEEQKMVSLARKGRGRMSPLYRKKPDIALEGGQKDAVAHILTTTDKVSIIIGRAGTGKTTLTKEAVKHIQRAGKQVLFVAPTAEASRGVLRAEGFKEAETVAKLLADPELQTQLKNQVLWVDEAGLLGTADMSRLLALCGRYNARLILSGDTRQHAAVVRGDALRILNQVAGIPAAQVAKIYRQRQVDYKEAVELLSKGQTGSAFEKLDKMEAIVQMNKNNPYQELVSDFIDAKRRKKSVLVVCPTHAESRMVTASIRDQLRQSGDLQGREKSCLRLVNLNLTEAEKSDRRHYPIGTVIQFSQNRPSIKRGSRWKVHAVTKKAVFIQDAQNNVQELALNRTDDFSLYQEEELPLLNGDEIRITQNGFDQDKRRLNNGQMLKVVGFERGQILAQNDDGSIQYTLPQNFGHLAHAYCLTSHASQGKTVDQVLIAQPAATFPAVNAKQFYVSVSRARDSVKIYTDDKASLLEQVQEIGDRTSATELWETRKKKRMLSHVARIVQPTVRNRNTKAQTQSHSSLSKPKRSQEMKLVP